MNDKFIVFYEMNHEECKTDFLTEYELGHQIAYLMRHGACNVRVVIFDSDWFELLREHFDCHTECECISDEEMEARC